MSNLIRGTHNFYAKPEGNGWNLYKETNWDVDLFKMDGEKGELIKEWGAGSGESNPHFVQEPGVYRIYWNCYGDGDIEAPNGEIYDIEAEITLA